MNEMREKEAINAYLKLLQTKGASNELLHKRSLFLDQLVASLVGQAPNGETYRDVVEKVMVPVPVDCWHDSLTTAREFYPFWVKDFKAIAAININSGFEVKPIDWKPVQVTLKTLSDSLETEKFEASENWPLKAYTQALRFEGAEQSLVDTRVKLAKVLLIRLRTAPDKDSKSYRVAVDLTLPLFTINDSRRLFLVVVREFYHFWSGNPNAASMVLKEGSGNTLI
ncbi:MAG: hypothetical protein Q8J66_05045 [Methylotenera sp.]|nr:hypothetical protein [Methylotenera sp.]